MHIFQKAKQRHGHANQIWTIAMHNVDNRSFQIRFQLDTQIIGFGLPVWRSLRDHVVYFINKDHWLVNVVSQDHGCLDKAIEDTLNSWRMQINDWLIWEECVTLKPWSQTNEDETAETRPTRHRDRYVRHATVKQMGGRSENTALVPNDIGAVVRSTDPHLKDSQINLRKRRRNS